MESNALFFILSYFIVCTLKDRSVKPVLFCDDQNLGGFLFMIMDSLEPGVSLYGEVWEGRKKRDLTGPSRTFCLTPRNDHHPSMISRLFSELQKSWCVGSFIQIRLNLMTPQLML